MKRRIRFLGVAAMVLVLVLAFAGTAMAAEPIVSITAASPGGGNLEITTSGVDTSTWHPGSIGEVNTFTADGQFDATYKAYTGSYGRLNTYVNAASSYGGEFTMGDTQDFDILSANGSHHTFGDFTAYAGGDTAAMNLKSIGSMYCWSEATNGGVGLQGDVIYKTYDMKTNGTLTSSMLIQAIATGGASIYNSAAWGFGANQNGTITTNYGSGTRSLTATGTGSYRQYVSAGTSATSYANMLVDGAPVVVNGALPIGGALDIIANFVNSFSASNYSVTAN